MASVFVPWLLTLACVTCTTSESQARSDPLADLVSASNAVLRLAPAERSIVVSYHPGNLSILAEVDWEGDDFAALMAVGERGTYLVDWEGPDTLVAAFTEEGTCDGFVARIDLPARRRAHAAALSTSRGFRRQRADLSAIPSVNRDLPLTLRHWGDLERHRWAGIEFFDHPQRCVSRWAEGELLEADIVAAKTREGWKTATTGSAPAHLLGVTSHNRLLASRIEDGKTNLLQWTNHGPEVLVSVPGARALTAYRWPGTDTVYRAAFTGGPDYFIDPDAASASRHFPLAGDQRATIIDSASDAVLVLSAGRYFIVDNRQPSPVLVEAARPWSGNDGRQGKATGRLRASPDAVTIFERAALERLGIQLSATGGCTAQRARDRDHVAWWQTKITCGTSTRVWRHLLARETDADRAERLAEVAKFVSDRSATMTPERP